uniref:Cytochrome b6/f complex subunit VI n=1 Tax=Bryopsis hypnoides TaxID=222885 RepID=D0EVT0_BRYHP|nr:cytochrome b6/f complex subunit VI [Bryopsis hypnoides]ACX33744.1 cytochrome b6/f complex subunit VI [Bryopsis hypnoides]
MLTITSYIALISVAFVVTLILSYLGLLKGIKLVF